MNEIRSSVILDENAISRVHLEAMVPECQHRVVDEVFYHYPDGRGWPVYPAILSLHISSDGTGECLSEVFPEGRAFSGPPAIDAFAASRQVSQHGGVYAPLPPVRI
jgi:hypothetical protein